MVKMDEPYEDFQELYHDTICQHFQYFSVNKSSWRYELIELDLGKILLLKTLEVHWDLLFGSESNFNEFLFLLDFLNNNDDLLIFNEVIKLLLIN